MNAYEDIVCDLAAACSKRVCRRVIRHLQRNGTLLSGDDSPLATVWDEVCVQVQYQESALWSAYDDVIRGWIESEVDKLAGYELCALWLQTPTGIQWACSEAGEDGPAPVTVVDVVEHVAGELYGCAADWSNHRIRLYLAE